MIELAKKDGMPAVAITDHGNMYGAIDFYEQATEAGLNPIIGMETYIIDGSIHSKKDRKKTRYHLTLLVKNLTGYYNLIKLSSIAFLEGFYYKPRIDKKLLKKYSEGLIALSGCFKGELPQLILAGKYEKAKKNLITYQDIFGKENFFLEIMRLDLEDEEVVINGLIKLSEETGAELVCTNDNHYLQKSGAKVHDVLLCVQTGKLLSDENRMKFNTDQVYFKTTNEMQKLFSDFPSAFENTVKIADKCNLKLKFDKFLLPKISIPDKYKNMDDYLKKIVFQEAEKKYEKVTEKIKKRIEYELEIIEKTGFAGYFLVTREIVMAARKMGTMVGPGRGSAAGSIVSYLTDITRIDPLKYDLIFERFLNPDRISMPDIDIDFSAETRNNVIDFIVKRFGRKNVSQIITFGSLKARMVVRDVGRVMGLSQSEVNRIAKMIDTRPGITLKQAMAYNPDLKELIESKDENKQLMEYSQILEGLLRHFGVHAAGLVVAPDDLMNYVPLAKSIKDESVITQYEGKWLEKLKLLKLDCLGLKNLTVIEKTIESIKTNYNEKIDIDKINLNDIKTYELLCNGDTDGVFQFESTGMRTVLMQIKPNCIEDLAICTALYRPGPLNSGMHKVYIRRKNDEEDIVYLHPKIEEILRPTYGVIIFQEQVMQIANKLAGFTFSEADVLRKAMSKKIKSVMNRLKPKFIEGSVNNGVNKQTAKKIFELIEKFGQYGFNKSHSVAYGIISYQTAYLKANYPTEFMAALMTVEQNNDKIAKFINNCKRMKIEVLPPDVNRSEYNFTVVKKSALSNENSEIIFGLKAIKNMGENASKAIVEGRKSNVKYSNIFGFCEKIEITNINKTSLESLIATGAMDNLDGNRAQKYAVIETALNFGAQKNIEKNRGQSSLFDNDFEEKNIYPALPKIDDWKLSYKLQREKELLGFYISGHPLANHKEEIHFTANFDTKKYKEFSENKEKISGDLRIFALLNEISQKTDRNGNLMAFLKCEDLYGKFEVVLFATLYLKYGKNLKEGEIFYFVGRISNKDSQNAENLKFVAQRIIPINSLNKKLSGNVFIDISETNIGKINLKSFVKNISAESGKFALHFRVKTKIFGLLDIASQKYKIFPGKKFYDFVNKNNEYFEKVKVEFQ